MASAARETALAKKAARRGELEELRAAIVKTCDAADRHARELLNQAANYERLGQQPVADETLRKHYRPLRKAIDTVRGLA